jgi:hypothetical protein
MVAAGTCPAFEKTVINSSSIRVKYPKLKSNYLFLSSTKTIKLSHYNSFKTCSDVAMFNSDEKLNISL